MFRKQSAVVSIAGAVALVGGLVLAAPAHAVDRGAAVPNTYANRHVAKVFGRSACTGTLVSPNLVLTALHCIHHPEPNPPLHEPNWKKDPDRLNHEDWEQPGRFYDLIGHTGGIKLDFGSNASVYNADYHRTATQYAIATSTDSVLLRFSPPVHASMAMPVPVLTRTPGPDPTFWNSKLLTIMGYGGSLYNNTQGTFKTWATNAASTCNGSPNYVCSAPTGNWDMAPADAGGPQFWTDPAGQKWLIASNATGSPGRASGVRTSHRGAVRTTDRFPDQAEFYDRILGAQDVAFTQVDAVGKPYPGATQVLQGQTPSVAHPGTGQYNVVLPKVTAANTLIVAAHGTTGAHCQGRSAGGSSNFVECFAQNGTRVDTGFSILATSRYADPRATVQLSGTTAQVANGSTPGVTTKPTVERTYEGQYTVTFNGLVGSLASVIVSTLQGSGSPNRCSVRSWTGNAVNVGCTRPNGSIVDAGFAVLGTRKDALEKRSDMFAWANQPTATQYAVPASYAQQNSGTPVSQRLGTGHYRLHFGAAQNTFSGVWMVSSYNRPDVHCGINPSNFYADIRCRNSQGVLTDVMYSARHLKPAN